VRVVIEEEEATIWWYGLMKKEMAVG